MPAERFTGLLPILALAVPVVGALGSLYLMTNSAYAKATALEQRVATLEISSHAQELKIQSLCSALVETETQFKSADQTRNIIHANDLRMEAVLFKKMFGSDYPIDNAYYPTIAQEHPQPCG